MRNRLMAWKASNGTGILVYVTFVWLVRLRATPPLLEPLAAIGWSLTWAGLKVQTFEDYYIAAEMMRMFECMSPFNSYVRNFR